MTHLKWSWHVKGATVGHIYQGQALAAQQPALDCHKLKIHALVSNSGRERERERVCVCVCECVSVCECECV